MITPTKSQNRFCRRLSKCRFGPTLPNDRQSGEFLIVIAGEASLTICRLHAF